MSIYRITDRQLSHLRTFRGYTEDEAELAARAADEIELLRAVAGAAEQFEHLATLLFGDPTDKTVRVHDSFAKAHLLLRAALGAAAVSSPGEETP
jgi:plasmid stabilization system protein ParE